MAQRVGIAALDRFHARQGDEFLLNSFGTTPGAWGRFFGRSSDQSWSPSIGGMDFQLAPSLDSRIWGIQAGLDLLGRETDSGAQDRLGVFLTHTDASGETTGNTLGLLQNESGRLSLEGNGLGAYWTHIEPEGWYLDAVAMVTWLRGGATSDRGIGADISGSSVLASLEAGYPFVLTEDWTLEPQAQLIWQHVDLNDTSDAFSSIDYDAFQSVTGRLGVRLEGNMTLNDMPIQPFVDLNLWHDFSSSYTVTFNDRLVRTNLEGTSLEFGGGVSAQASENVSAFGALSYTTSLDGSGNEGFGGNFGLRIKW
jgi:outer membrane autotransporter barrel domain